MSLRTFHLFFISVSILLSLFLLVWGLWFYRNSGNPMGLGMVLFSLGGIALLVGYFRWFRKKYSTLALVLIVACMATILNSSLSQACSVCYGDPNSPMSKAALMGVAVLAVIVICVLSLITAVAYSWNKRAKSLSIHL